MIFHSALFLFNTLYLKVFICFFYSFFIASTIMIDGGLGDYWAKTQSKCFVLCYYARPGIELVSPFITLLGGFYHVLFLWNGEPIK